MCQRQSIESTLELEMICTISNEEGKNSNTFLMYDPQLDDKFVVKVIEKSKFDNIEDFFKESKILNYVSHPNITKIQHATSDDNYIFISMPYYKNGSLQSLLNKRFLTLKEIIQISLDFLTGLHYIHTKKLIHFDIKPSNILLNKNDRASLTDFGLSKYVDEDGLSSQSKAYYSHRAPEQLMASKTSNATDIYQAGVTLLRMCNGNDFFYKKLKEFSNFQEVSDAIAQNNFPPKNHFLPHIPPRLKRIVKKALKYEVDDRYETVIDMINDISKIEKNTDWVYNKISEDNMEWITENNSGTHWEKIILEKQNDFWDIKGKKIRKKDDYTQNMHNRTASQITSKNKAFDKIYKFIMDSN